MPSLSLKPTALAMPPRSCLENDNAAQAPGFYPVDCVSPLSLWQTVKRPCLPPMKDDLWRGELLPDQMVPFVSSGTWIDGQPPSAANRDRRCQRLMAADGFHGASCPPAMDGWGQPVGGGTLIRCVGGEPVANTEYHYVEPLHAAAGNETTKEEVGADFSATPPEATPAMGAFAAFDCESSNRGTNASAAVDPTLSTSPPNGLEAVIPFGTPPGQADDCSAPSYEGWVAYDDPLGLFHPSQGDPACPLLSVDDIDALFDGMAAPVTSLGMHVNNRGKEAATRPSPATLVCDRRLSPAWSHGSDSDTDSDLPTLEELIASVPYRKRVAESGTSISNPIDLTME